MLFLRVELDYVLDRSLKFSVLGMRMLKNVEGFSPFVEKLPVFFLPEALKLECFAGKAVFILKSGLWTWMCAGP